MQCIVGILLNGDKFTVMTPSWFEGDSEGFY
jgi:hypothetical protein